MTAADWWTVSYTVALIALAVMAAGIARSARWRRARSAC